jgi:hypothetical protein
MLGVTFFGLFLTPVFYVIVRTLEKMFTGRAQPVEHSTATVHPSKVWRFSLQTMVIRPRRNDDALGQQGGVAALDFQDRAVLAVGQCE